MALSQAALDLFEDYQAKAQLAVYLGEIERPGSGRLAQADADAVAAHDAFFEAAGLEPGATLEDVNRVLEPEAS